MTTNKADNVLWRIPNWFPKLDPKFLADLTTFHAELLKFNVKLNLISRNTERDADEVHFADALYFAEILKPVSLVSPVYDLGSGNGIPGLVMAILRPEVQFYLVESDQRKSEFMKHVIHVLKLPNAQVMSVRLETLKASEMQTAISRGFASITKSLLAVNRSFVNGGKFYHMKGTNWGLEIAEIPTQLISHWAPELIGEYSLPDSQARRAVVCTTKLV